MARFLGGEAGTFRLCVHPPRSVESPEQTSLPLHVGVSPVGPSRFGDTQVILRDPHADPSIWAHFHAQQRACYARYGATGALTEGRLDPAATWMVCVVDSAGTLEAGAKLSVRTRRHRLPIEVVLADDERLAAALEARSSEGVAEVGSLWAARTLAGHGIGGALIAATVAFSAMVGVRHLVSLAHQFNRFTRRVGFEPDPMFDSLPYPDARYRSTINWCDARDISGAEPEVRHAIFEMRRRAFSRTAVLLASYPVAVDA